METARLPLLEPDAGTTVKSDPLRISADGRLANEGMEISSALGLAAGIGAGVGLGAAVPPVSKPPKPENGLTTAAELRAVLPANGFREDDPPELAPDDLL